jgi:metallo-beta-lactamase family protein
MILNFLGADHEVTGSCHYLAACGKNILVDCGMEQGNDVYENQELPIPAADVDYIFLTHAHIDHSGLIPLMYAKGFRGKVYATKASKDLCDIMLKDSAHIQMFEAEWRNRKAERSKSLDKFVPLYDVETAMNAMKCFVGCDYGELIEVCEGVTIRFTDAGHLLGSASIEVWLREENLEKKIVFSGDIGNLNKPIVRDPAYIHSADYVVMESTYGDRSHGGTPDYVGELRKIFKKTFARGGNVVIPSFAVGRTQELLYFIRRLKEENVQTGELPDFDVYVDSPLAIEATSVFNKNIDACFDEEAMELVRQGINPLVFPGLKLSITSDESKQINYDKTPKVIISASGMCEAGRIRHHLKHNLWRRECTVVFVGYQAVGTLGRTILEGAKEVKIFGEPIEVNAEITQLGGASSHADREGLLTWIREYEPKPQKVFVVHGEDNVCELFAETLNNELGISAVAPYTGSSYDLATGDCIKEGSREKKSRRSVAGARSQSIYQRLVDAGRRLMTVIAHNEFGANKDLAKFTDQINALCDKWDR